MSSSSATATAAARLVRQKYRSLGKLVNLIPEAKGSSSLCPEKSREQLREAFREPLRDDETVEDRIQKADAKLSFLRMITPKPPTDSHSGRWVYYKNGKKVEGGTSQTRDKNGKVHTNWDGKNLDPCSVKQHSGQLKRMGFRNNSHAKGFF